MILLLHQHQLLWKMVVVISLGLDVSVFDLLEPIVVLGLVAAIVGFCGGDLGLGNVAIGGLLCLNDFLLIEVSMFCTSFSFFIFFSTSCLNTSVLLSFV
ncbi:hypothetical protein Hanom_Chr00s000100g01620271 [Helianthus anomalus]